MSVRRHLAQNVIAYLALFVALGGSSYAAVKIGSAQIADNSLRSADIRDRGVKGVDIAKRTLRADNFRAGVLPGNIQAAQGPAGPPGDVGPRGPSFGDGRQVPNLEDLACGVEVQVGSLPVTVAAPSRIWTHAHGAISRDGAPVTEGGLRLRLRDTAGTIVATSVRAWDADGAQLGDDVWALSTGGVLLAGNNAENPAPVFVATAGAYTLELTARAQGGPGCTIALPDFGWNQGGAMGYVLLGTG
jgi:hypothetical protein